MNELFYLRMSITPLIQHHTGILDNIIRQEKRYVWFVDQKEKQISYYLPSESPGKYAEDKRDADLIPGLGRCPGRGHGSPLQYSCLENPMDRGTWPATVHKVTKSWI